VLEDTGACPDSLGSLAEEEDRGGAFAQEVIQTQMNHIPTHAPTHVPTHAALAVHAARSIMHSTMSAKY